MRTGVNMLQAENPHLEIKSSWDITAILGYQANKYVCLYREQKLIMWHCSRDSRGVADFENI